MKRMLFKKGDSVKVINPNNHFFDKCAKVIMFDGFTDKYLLQFNDGYKTEMYDYDIVRNLSAEEQKKLNKAFILQLADWALEIGDKAYFMKVTGRLKYYEGVEIK